MSENLDDQFGPLCIFFLRFKFTVTSVTVNFSNRGYGPVTVVNNNGGWNSTVERIRTSCLLVHPREFDPMRGIVRYCIVPYLTLLTLMYANVWYRRLRSAFINHNWNWTSSNPKSLRFPSYHPKHGGPLPSRHPPPQTHLHTRPIPLHPPHKSMQLHSPTRHPRTGISAAQIHRGRAHFYPEWGVRGGHESRL